MNLLRILLLGLISFGALAQPQLSTKSKKAIELYTEADNYRVRGQFNQAISLLNQAIDKDKNFIEAYYRLGLVYLNARAYPRAIENFERGLTLANDVRKQKVFWFDLGEAYLLVGEYEKAMKVLSAFVNNESQNKAKIDRATMLFRNAEFALKNKNAASAFRQREMSDTINFFVRQYFPVLTADERQIIFTRMLGHDMARHDEDLVVSVKNSKGEWTRPVSISPNINSPGNEGTCTISADGRKLIFTACDRRDGFGSCDLYESEKIGNEWTRPRNLGPNVNSGSWESQPTLSADGRTVYFVSDRRSGLGRRDIWVSKLDEKNQWLPATNLGKTVNSIYDELSPFIHANNRTLYFASNGLLGFGGLDIYFVERESSGWSAPKNIGAPINDHDDQFSLFITADGERGYYSHEERTESGLEVSKIYEIDIPEEQRVRFRSNYVRGVVRDKETRNFLSATIELIDIGNNAMEALVKSDSVSGEYLMVLTQGAEYALYVNKPGYIFKSLNFNYSEVEHFEPIVVDIELERAKAGSVVVLNNIFFDVDKYDLQEKSTAELQKVIRFMNENPHIKIEIGGHTDNSGTPEYNYQLSQKRATSVLDYLQTHGLDIKRLSPRGYGPDRPVADNSTEEGRKQNRRIEFKIVK